MNQAEARSRARYRIEDLSADETDEVLNSQTSAVLAFVDAEGYPRQFPCWFLHSDGRFYVTSIAGKFHVRRLEANPKASICVEVDVVRDSGEPGTELRGHWQVKGVGDVRIYPDAEKQIGERIRQKYLGPSGVLPTAAEDRVVIELTPHKLTAHGGRLRVATQS